MRTDRRRALRTMSVVAALAVALQLGPSRAHHATGHDQNPLPPPPLGPTEVLHFEAGSLVIPMDACFQRPGFMSTNDIEQTIAPLTINSAKCNGTNDKDDGLIPAYSLMFHLIEQGVPVHWSIRNAKSSFHDIDFSIVRAGGSPAYHRKPGGAVSTTRYQAITTLRYRGAPFVIAAADAARALQVMDSLANTCAEGTCFKDVDIHIAQVSFDAPIYRTVESLPTLAIIDASDTATDLQNEKTGFLDGSVKEALMTGLEGTLYDWVTIPEVLSDRLTTGDYDLVWVPPFELKTGEVPTARQQAFLAKLAAFADGGGSVLFQDGSISAVEGWGDWSGGYDQKQQPVQDFHTDGGILANGVTSSWDNGNDDERTIGQDYSDPASQFGGIVWTGIGGSKYNWRPRQDRAYHPGVRRMIYTDHRTDGTKDNWDIATWRHKDNDPDKGVIYYLGGYHWRRVTASGFRVLMNTLLATAGGGAEEVVEVSRSAPIVALVDGTEAQYQGTFETQYPPEPASTFASMADDDEFEFPHVRGHLRAIDLSQLSAGTTSYDDIDGSPALRFDAADGIPAVDYAGEGCGTFTARPADGQCRRIFTETGAAAEPELTMVVQGNVATLQPLLGSQFDTTAANTLIARIHAGRVSGTSRVPALGGVDRSTLAVIEPSPLIPNGRPTMAYFGGRDGMLHAVCAEAGGGCPAAGVELWAFLPSTELSKVATNTTRIDGSPTVADVFGDFAGGRGIRTVLTFQTGNREPAATYALDITDPTRPEVLWRLDTPGPGVRTAMGWVRDSSMIRPVTFVQTATAPGTASGFEVRAVDTVTGDLLWDRQVLYPYPTRNDLNPEVPGTAMPGGVTLVPGITQTRIDHVLVPSLYGQVYLLDARTGENELGEAPLFDFDEDFHPIGASVSLYRGRDDGVLRGLVVSGGFADPFAPSGTEWAPDDVNQYAVGFPVVVNGQSNYPIRRADVELDETLGIHIDLGAGQRAFSPAVIAGNELFITTDTANVNAADYGSVGDTGRLWRADLSGSGTQATYVTVPSGAASVDVSITSGAVVTGGGDGVVRSNPVGFDAVGTTVEVRPEMYGTRRLWLRMR